MNTVWIGWQSMDSLIGISCLSPRSQLVQGGRPSINIHNFHKYLVVVVDPAEELMWSRDVLQYVVAAMIRHACPME